MKVPQIAPIAGMTPLGFKPDVKGMLERRANTPLKPKQDQRPCDAGLFSDDARQLDLVTLCQSKPSK